MKTNERTYVLMSGWARSGAALTGAMINAHSDADFSVDVLKYFNFCYKRYPNLNRDVLVIMIKEMRIRLKTRFGIDLDMDYCLKTIGDNMDHWHIYRVLMSHIVARKSPKKIVGEYEGVVWGKIPCLLDNVKNSKAIIIVRDPRDVLVSFKKNTIAPKNDYLITVFNYLDLMESWVKYEKLYPDRVLGIRFERLKSDPELVARKICNFLDIEFESGMLNNDQWKVLKNNNWEVWENHNTSSFRDNDNLKSNPVGRWRGLIDPVDHFICEWILRDVMAIFNMELEFSKPTDKILEIALERLMSSKLLKEAFLNYTHKRIGSEKYPMDPCNSLNWDKRILNNIDAYKK
jgi:hypothetical protein